MKLLYIIDYFDNPYGGTELQFWRLLEGMRARGHDVQLAVFRDTEYTARTDFPFPKINLGIKKMLSPSTILKVVKLAKWAKHEGFEVLHIFFNDASILCPVIFRLYGIPVIVSRRDMGFWINGVWRIPLAINSLVVSRYIVNCNAVKDITCKLEYACRDKVEVVFNGYVGGEKNFEDEKFLSYRNAIDGLLIIGIVANYHPVKRLEDAIEAIALIKSDFPNLRLAVVGDRNKEFYQDLVVARELEQQVLFLGQVSNAIMYIRTFDIAVLCSASEGLSNSIIEYMKQGKPVVATETGGNTDLVIAGETGLLVNVACVNELAAAFTELLQDAKKRQHYGENGRAYIDEKFSNEHMLDRHDEIYSALAG